MAIAWGPLPAYPVLASSAYAVSGYPVHRFDAQLAAGNAGQAGGAGPGFAEAGDGVHDFLVDQGAVDVVAVAADPGDPGGVRDVQACGIGDPDGAADDPAVAVSHLMVNGGDGIGLFAWGSLQVIVRHGVVGGFLMRQPSSQVMATLAGSVGCVHSLSQPGAACLDEGGRSRTTTIVQVHATIAVPLTAAAEASTGIRGHLALQVRPHASRICSNSQAGSATNLDASGRDLAGRDRRRWVV